MKNDYKSISKYDDTHPSSFPPFLLSPTPSFSSTFLSFSNFLQHTFYLTAASSLKDPHVTQRPLMTSIRCRYPIKAEPITTASLDWEVDQREWIELLVFPVILCKLVLILRHWLVCFRILVVPLFLVRCIFSTFLFWCFVLCIIFLTQFLSVFFFFFFFVCVCVLSEVLLFPENSYVDLLQLFSFFFLSCPSLFPLFNLPQLNLHSSPTPHLKLAPKKQGHEKKGIKYTHTHTNKKKPQWRPVWPMASN